MKRSPSQGLLAEVFRCIGLSVGVVFADASYPVLLERYDRDIRENPQNYLKRVERAALILGERDTGKTTLEDIDTLSAHAEWRNEANCLRAVRLHLQGRLDDAKNLIQKNLRAGAQVPQQARLLAKIELTKKDTAAALSAYRLAWDSLHDENDFIDLLILHRGRGEPPEELLKDGLRRYPNSPGAIQTIFEVYIAAAGPVNLEKGLELSMRAEKTLWPLSVDWKIRHAEVLLSLQRHKETETVLLAALDLLDGDARMQGKGGKVFRSKIFALLDSADKGVP